MRNIAVVALIVFAFVFAAALSTAVTGQEILSSEQTHNRTGYTMFATLCRDEAGYRHLGVQENVDGYLVVDEVVDEHRGRHGCDMICASSLLAEGYKYIETHVNIPDKQYLTEKIGNYRFSIQKKGDDRCFLYDIFLSNYYESLPDNFPLSEDNCIASELVEDFTSRAVRNIKYEIIFESDREEVFKYTDTKSYDGTILDQVTLFSYKIRSNTAYKQCNRLIGVKSSGKRISEIFLVP